MNPYSNGTKHRGSKPLLAAAKSRADSRLPHFLSVLPPLLDSWHFSPALAIDREGRHTTDFLYFVRGVPGHTYPSLLRSHQTPMGDFPPSWQEACHVTITSWNEIELGIPLVEGERQTMHCGYCSFRLKGPGRRLPHSISNVKRNAKNWIHSPTWMQ
jgi:hypothetical protein